MVFQDMSKAYDTVDLDVLSMALLRVKIPTKIVSTIRNCFANILNTVITSVGLTQPYTIANRIDQGDTISPILWRIYYDPLIEMIEKQRGYKTVNKYID